MSKSTTNHKTALDAHAKAAAKVQETAELLAKTRAEEQELHDVPMAALLATPGKAAEVAEARTRVRELLALHESMLAGAEEQEEEATRAVLAAEADGMQPAVDAAQRKLDEWNRVEAELRGKLEAHVGRAYVQVDPFENWTGGTMSVLGTTDAPLRGELAGITAQQAALMAASRGEEPTGWCDADRLPASLLPGGIRPSRAAQANAQAEAEEKAHEAHGKAEQDQLDAACDALGVGRVPVVPGFERWGSGAVDRWLQSLAYNQVTDTTLRDLDVEALRVVGNLAGSVEAERVLSAVTRAAHRATAETRAKAPQ